MEWDYAGRMAGMEIDKVSKKWKNRQAKDTKRKIE